MNKRPRDHRTRTTGWIGKAGKASSRLKIPETRPSLGEERAENWYYLYVCTSCCLVGWLVGWLAGWPVMGSAMSTYTWMDTFGMAYDLR